MRAMLCTAVAVLAVLSVSSGTAAAADYGLAVTVDGAQRFTYPFDRHIHRVLTVTNRSSAALDLVAWATVVNDGVRTRLAATSSPERLTLQPGESQRLVISALWSELKTSSWRVGGTYEQPIVVQFWPALSTEPQEAVVRNVVTVLAPFACEPRCALPRPAPVRNATIAGRVVDAGGKPLAGIPVVITAPNSGAAPARVSTDRKGSFRTVVGTRKQAVSGAWTSFSVRAAPVPARGLQSRGAVVAAVAGRTASVTLALPRRVERVSYALQASVALDARPYRAAASAAGDLFAVGPRGVFDSSAVLRLVDGAGATAWANRLPNGAAGPLAISPDGQLVAAATLWRGIDLGAEVLVFDRSGAEVGRFLIEGNRADPRTNRMQATVLRFSPDSRYLFVGSGDGRWFLRDARSLAIVWQGGAGVPPVFDDAVFSADGGRIFLGDGDGYVRALDAATGALLWQQWVGGPAISLAASPSRVLVSGESAPATVLLDAASGAVVARYPQEYHVNDAALSPDASRVYLAGGPDADAICRSLDGSLRPLWDLGVPCANVALSRDARHVVVAGSDFVALLTAAGDVLWRAPFPDRAAAGPAPGGYVWISDDESRIVVVSPYTSHLYVYRRS